MTLLPKFIAGLRPGPILAVAADTGKVCRQPAAANAAPRLPRMAPPPIWLLAGIAVLVALRPRRAH